MKDPKYLKAVRLLGCVICGAAGQAHHKTGAGMGMKADDHDTFCLCHTHHTTGGREVAIHAGTKTWEAIYGSQSGFIRTTQRQLNYQQKEELNV